jgi:single-stranded DNA-binding protein
VISVSIVGRVVDRPFRPGNAQRVVLKLDAEDERGRSQRIEVDGFGEIGDWIMKNVTMGEILAITGRLEQRTYKDRGEEVDELRVVAVRCEPTARRSAGPRVDGGRPDPNRADGVRVEPPRPEPNRADDAAPDPNAIS